MVIVVVFVVVYVVDVDGFSFSAAVRYMMKLRMLCFVMVYV